MKLIGEEDGDECTAEIVNFDHCSFCHEPHTCVLEIGATNEGGHNGTTVWICGDCLHALEAADGGLL